MLEKTGGCLSALVMLDGGPPAAMDSLAVEGGVLTARVSTPEGDARVQLTLGESDATGLIRSGRSTWKVEGKRTV